ncbi:MAG: DUF2330 domain-containing protein [Candidatus Eremiobacteraeota bacterium]|nr:DUF2330 domain-containing protein [Candidatus Eremiobacteraeota bacterium]
MMKINKIAIPFILIILVILSGNPVFADGCRVKSMSGSTFHGRERVIPASSSIKYPTEMMRVYERCIDSESWQALYTYTSPTQQAIISHKNGEETLIIEVPPLMDKEFAWIVPMPAYPKVEKEDEKLFPEISNRAFNKLFSHFALIFYDTYSGLLARGEDNAQREVGGAHPVIVYERKVVGAFDIAILSADDPASLLKWLKDNRFFFPEKGKDVVNFYIKKKWFFVAMKVNNSEGADSLHPIKFSFKSNVPIYPMKMTSIEEGTTHLNLYVFSDGEKGAEGLYRIWHGDSSSLTDKKKGKGKEAIRVTPDVPEKLTVLTLRISNDKIEDDIILRNTSSGAFIIPVIPIIRYERVILGFAGSWVILTLILAHTWIIQKKRINLTFIIAVSVMAGILFIIFLVFSPILSKHIGQKQFEQCQNNFRNIGTALEMYATDNSGHYPTSLKKVTPMYLLTIPTCPYSGDDSYSGAYFQNEKPDRYTMFCKNRHANFIKKNSPPVVFPRCGEKRIILDNGG